MHSNFYFILHTSVPSGLRGAYGLVILGYSIFTIMCIYLYRLLFLASVCYLIILVFPIIFIVRTQSAAYDAYLIPYSGTHTMMPTEYIILVLILDYESIFMM